MNEYSKVDIQEIIDWLREGHCEFDLPDYVKDSLHDAADLMDQLANPWTPLCHGLPNEKAAYVVTKDFGSGKLFEDICLLDYNDAGDLAFANESIIAWRDHIPYQWADHIKSKGGA